MRISTHCVSAFEQTTEQQSYYYVEIHNSPKYLTLKPARDDLSAFFIKLKICTIIITNGWMRDGF